MKAMCRKMSSERWQAAWHSESKGRASFRYAVTPSKRVLKLHEGLSKSQSSLLVQLRTEKIGLKRLSLSPESTGHIEPSVCLPRRTADGTTRPARLQETEGSSGAGIWPRIWNDGSPDNLDKAQASHQSHQTR